MRECLLCRSCGKDGKILFLTYSESENRIREYLSDEITQLIVEKKIDNAKLENTVVKITDSRGALPNLSYEEKGRSCVYYIIGSYRSDRGSAMLRAVSNTGEMFEFSSNMAADFCRDRQVLNAYLTKAGLKVINVPTFTTALNKPLDHAETD